MSRLAAHAAGWILIEEATGVLNTLSVESFPCADPAGLSAVVESAAAGLPVDAAARPSVQGVIQQITRQGFLRDHRTGLEVPLNGGAEEFRAFFLAALPLPEELAAVFDVAR